MTRRQELVGRSTRGRFRVLMTSSTVGQIAAAFQDEGFAPAPDCTWNDGSARRTETQRHLESVDWADSTHVERALRVFEVLLEGFEGEHFERFRTALHRDGYELNEAGQIKSVGPALPQVPLAAVRDPQAIRDNLERIQRAMVDDPALAVGSAKDLVESTAKAVLIERGQQLDERDDLPALVRKSQQALDLHPSSATPGPDGSDAVKKILGSVTGVAVGVAELRNRYGTGHGGTTARVGLRPRHAHLAVNAAVTWCQLMLDTLADAEAPWQRSQP